MAKQNNPMKINQIRAEGTPLPGKRQKKQATKKQSKSLGRVGDIEAKIAEMEKNLISSFQQLNPALENMQKELRVRALETHVALDILGQNVCGREMIESLMKTRAPHFGLEIEYRKEAENQVKEGDFIEEDTVNEPSEGCAIIPATEEYEGAKGYSG